MDNNVIKNIQNMFPLWTVKNVRLSEIRSHYAEVDPAAPYVLNGNMSTTLSMDIESHGKPAPEWLDMYKEQVNGVFAPDGTIVESITYNLTDSLANFYISNKKKVDAYHKEHWNSVIRQQFDELFSGQLEEQNG